MHGVEWSGVARTNASTATLHYTTLALALVAGAGASASSTSAVTYVNININVIKDQRNVIIPQTQKDTKRHTVSHSVIPVIVPSPLST